MPVLPMPAPPSVDQTKAAYRNPVLPGFFPDPSVVRVGADYYLVNSTFQYFPAIVISHSRDLVHWRQIGHVFTNPEELDLSGFLDGCGIWAPDISYHHGEFYVFYCLVQLTKDRSVNHRGNYMVKARSIHGPWSAPVKLTDHGNDPSHFVDDDGNHYLLFAGGVPRGDATLIARLQDDCTALAEPPRWLAYGPQRRAPEGPHLFKRGDWYYHTMASHGGYAASHHQIVARSRDIYGPYEVSPYNPMIVQNASDGILQGPGHAKLVQDGRGDWWAMYLCTRKPGGVATLGRETALSRVVWTADGWPVLQGGAEPKVVGVMPKVDGPEAIPAEVQSFRDDFDGDALKNDWQAVRELPETFASMATRPGWLAISTARPARALEPRNLLLVRERWHHYTATTHMSFHPQPGQEAGMACYYDSATHLTLGVTASKDEPGKWQAVLKRCMGGVESVIASTRLQPDQPIKIRVIVRGLQREFAVREPGADWTTVGTVADCAFLSDEGTPGWGFTGTMVGPYALADELGASSAACFDWFEMTSAT